MLKKYNIGFDIWALIFFFIIMIPNFYWFVFSAPNDILREESVTPVLDTIASVCQVLMIVVLCIFTHKDCKKIKITPFIIASVICCLTYFIGWIFYYNGVTNIIVILDLCVLPCLSFLFFAIDRKNIIAVVPIVIFTMCHLIYGIVNFIV